MRKTVMMMALVALFALVAKGADYAVMKTRRLVPCKGTSATDVLNERPGDGKRDVIYGFQRADQLRAHRYARDTDYLYGGLGNDRLNVLDGDYNDRAVGGPGEDFCFIDDESELSPTCENYAIP